ncbi:MAG: hypothetical protein KDD40_12745, partial [Bdellovibrionales bacterium]|nr:hypothetical protein [Bdellovibrionales bacterium]
AEWFKSSGYAVGGSFSFLKKISQDFYFSQPNVARWTEEKQMIDFQNGLSLTQLLPSERSLNYFLSMSGESEPAVGVQSYSLGVTFRTWLGWPWLHFDLTPFGAWSRARNFVFQPAIAAHFELIIGSF